MVAGFNVMEYHAPVVTVRDGVGWLMSGHFNLVHMVNLSSFEIALENLVMQVVEEGSQENKGAIDFYIHKTRENLSMLRGSIHAKRGRRSIDWLGSAWKWISGSPDRIDWEKIMAAEADIIKQNRSQFKINERIFDAVHRMVLAVNNSTFFTNEIIRNSSTSKRNQAVLNKLIILKNEVGEVIRACQMAKKGIVNNNLLDHEEVNRLISELEVLPYANFIQAMEYGRPMVFTNGSILLYVLSMPKVRQTAYHVIIARASIHNKKQVLMRHATILITQAETWGITENCQKLNNYTICREDQVELIPEGSCVPRAIKGGQAKCTYVTKNDVVIELLTENTIFVSNFVGYIANEKGEQHLNGTFLIQIDNESVQIGNNTYSSETVTSLQALPPALTNITMEKMEVTLELIHDISQENVKSLQTLKKNVTTTAGLNFSIIFLIILLLGVTWRKLTKRANIPTVAVNNITSQPSDQRDADT